MVHRSPRKDGGFNGLLESVTTFVALFADRMSRISRKLRAKPRRAGPKLLRSLTSLRNRTVPFLNKKKGTEAAAAAAAEEEDDDEFGDGGVWQREILMGDKCQPLEFSGAIYYDGNGNRLAELPPRSPRPSPFPRYVYGHGG